MTIPTHTLQLDTLAWDAARLHEAMDALVRRAHLASEAALDRQDEMTGAHPPPNLADADARNDWAQWLANRLDIEAEAVTAQYADVEMFVRGVAPAIIELEDWATLMQTATPQTPPRFLALLKSNARGVTLLTPELATQVVAPQMLRDLICQSIETPMIERTNQLLTQVGVPPEKIARVRQAMLAEQLGAARVARGWILRVSPGASYSRQWIETNAAPLTAIIFGASIAQQAFTVFAWAIIGQAALAGKFDWAWLGLWAILLLTGVPLQMLSGMASAYLGTNVGANFKTMLLYGATKLSPEQIRHEGAGTFLSRVLDANTVEYGAVAGVVQVLFAIIQIVTAFGVVWLGAGGWVSAASLALVTLVLFYLSFEFWRSNNRYVDTYRGMTNHLVERMIGYRTRIAQQAPADWHTDEDAELARYLQSSERQARVGNWLAVLPRVWMMLGLASIAPAFIAQTTTAEKMAIALGGILLAEQALMATTINLRALIVLGKAWEQIKPLFKIARQPNETGATMYESRGTDTEPFDNPEQIAAHPAPKKSSTALLALRDLSFRYSQRAKLALDQVSLEIFHGDRLLIEGPSGGGKSTLAAVLAGLRLPESGLMLLRGYDRASVSQETWRKHIAVAPQFHENHVFTGTFGFNLLMGRRWPAEAADGLEAIEICNELGLDELIAKMPSGTQQMVGDHGWQLSHGEKSRLYIARALLQRADLIILDESFAALDPQNLERALQCVFKRAPTLLVIAHP